jgi:hypothetical protein
MDEQILFDSNVRLRNQKQTSTRLIRNQEAILIPDSIIMPPEHFSGDSGPSNVPLTAML